MARTLSQRIAERAKTKLPSQSGKNRAAFLAIRDEVRQSIEDGWPIKSIWETLLEEGKIAFGYDSFIGYVDRLIRYPVKLIPPQVPAPGQATSKASRSAAALPSASRHRASGPPVPKPDSPSGFTFNPEPKKEDLI